MISRGIENDSTLDERTSRSRRSESLADATSVTGQVVAVGALGRDDRRAMFDLMETYFLGVTASAFARDLDEKEWAIVLRDARTNRICGFSTVMRTSAVVDGEPIVGVFSGDTIVDRDYWGETLLARLWSRHAFAVAAEQRPSRTFWFLICSGYKTYRFLPVFFREFFPRHDRVTPDRERAILDSLAEQKFGSSYDRRAGVVRPRDAAPLLPGVADVTSQRLRDPHVAHFARLNTGHALGDELVCITELVPSNLTSAGRRMVGERLIGTR